MDAGDEGGVVGREEGDRAGHFDLLTTPAEGIDHFASLRYLQKEIALEGSHVTLKPDQPT